MLLYVGHRRSLHATLVSIGSIPSAAAFLVILTKEYQREDSIVSTAVEFITKTFPILFQEDSWGSLQKEVPKQGIVLYQAEDDRAAIHKAL
ncbi:hypothetical protein P7C65_02s2g02330 [Encephalitozoon intestinalis]|nr:hypothetical protein GPK93_02g02540 [Encephalitozoon intestinalis]